MHFIIQTENDMINDVEEFTLTQILDRQSSMHSYSMVNAEDLIDFIEQTSSINFKEAIPVGDIKFVKEYLNIVHEICDIIPIEVPEELRVNKYLKRRYAVLEREEIPKKGDYFLKTAFKLKDFTYVGEISNLFEYENSGDFLKEGLYVLSERVNILSEYRCFVLNDIIKGIQFYSGDCTIMPTPDDVALIKEMVMKYSKNPNRPKAYTLDVGIIKDKGVAVLECHTHSSVGLYGYNDESLPYHYKFGFEWYLNNRDYELKKYNGFKESSDIANDLEEHEMEDGYLKFKNGYIGQVEDDVFWHWNLNNLKKKAKPISSKEALEKAYELMKSLESDEIAFKSK